MPENQKLSEMMENAIRDAEQELKEYPIMPEHYSTVMRHPAMDPKGYYSQIDFDIAARIRRCDTFSNTKGILDKAMYEHVYNEIETKGGDLKKEVVKLSMKHRVYTRAARICKDPDAKAELTKLADNILSSKAVKDYNLLITSLEYYAGVHSEIVMPGECIDALDRCIGYRTDGEIAHPISSTSTRLKTTPAKMKIDLRNMDDLLEQLFQSNPAVKEKSEEEKEKLGLTDKLFDATVTPYSKDACKDTLDALIGNLEERMDLLIIDGQTLRETIEAKTNKKNPTKEEIETLSCEYVMAALRTGGRVEAFTPYLTSDTSKTYRPDPVVIEGSEPKERVTMRFWEVWLAKLGFFKDKMKQYEEQQKEDERMEACRERVRKKLTFKPATREEMRAAREAGLKNRIVKNSLTKAEKKEQEVRRGIIENYKDDYVKAVRMREKVRGQKDALLYSFYPDAAKNRSGVNLNSKVDQKVPKLFRARPLYYAVAQMLIEGHSLEEVLDTSRFQEDRARIGREFQERFEKMTLQEYRIMHVDSMMALAKAMPEFAKEMSQVIKTREDIMDNYHKFYVGAMCMNVLYMDHEKRPETIAHCGGEKEYDALVAKLAEADPYYGLKDSYDALYQNFHRILDGEEIRIASVLENNLKEELVLMGLKGKEPQLAPKLFENNLPIVTKNLENHPEAKRLQAKADKVDTKMLAEVAKTGTSTAWKIGAEVFDEVMVTTKNSGIIDAGESLGLNVIINEKKMLQLEEPVLEQNEL